MHSCLYVGSCNCHRSNVSGHVVGWDGLQSKVDQLLVLLHFHAALFLGSMMPSCSATIATFLYVFTPALQPSVLSKGAGYTLRRRSCLFNTVLQVVLSLGCTTLDRTKHGMTIPAIEANSLDREEDAMLSDATRLLKRKY